MILTTHAVVGAALASFVPSHPAVAFVLGFGSHFILDAIPHVDYPIRSRSVNPRIGAPMAFDRALLQDFVTIGSDGLFGLVAALFLFSSATNFWAVLLGAVGAILPDPLQFAYTRLPHEPLRTLQRFHRWAHSKKKIGSVVFGAGTQAAFVALVTGLTRPFIAAFSFCLGDGLFCWLIQRELPSTFDPVEIELGGDSRTRSSAAIEIGSYARFWSCFDFRIFR